MRQYLKKIILFILLAGLNLPLSALSLPNFRDFSIENSSLEVRFAGFYPSSHRFDKIYGDTVAYSIEASTPFNCSFRVWADLDWTFNRGKVRNCDVHTRADIFNLGIGVDYLFSINNCFIQLDECIQPYVGIGPTFGKLNLKNEGCCFHDKQTKYSAGLLAKLGVFYYISCQVFVDFFVDYLYQPVHFKHNHCQNIGGVRPGIGLGWEF